MNNRIMSTVLSVLFCFLVLGLFYNQVIRYGYYSHLSKNNSIRILPITGPRGTIYDRTGKALAANRLSFDVSIVSQELRQRKKVESILSRVVGMSDQEIAEAFEKADTRPHAPVTIAEDIAKEKAIAVEEECADIDGIDVRVSSKRDYVHRSSGSHVLGYLGEITEDELENLGEYGYRPRDLIGRDGLEKQYEKQLKGVDGGTQIEVDSRGRQRRVIGVKEPEKGTDLFLTIDGELQSACDKLLGDRTGAVVVMDPRNGEILALASHPAFDPNIFVKPNTSVDRLALIDDKAGRPLSNKAISGLYPPGSVFKIVTASAALETGKIRMNTTFVCNGSYRLGNTTFDCWKKEGHGPQDVVNAIMNSCNVFFYNTGRLIGVDNLESYAKLFGYGQKTDIDLPDEVKGIAPGRAWKRERRHQEWLEGETINYSIGQGYLLVTPLQVLDMVAVMANQGNLVTPHIVKRIGDDDAHVSKPKHIGLNPRTIKAVREGLYEVINNEHGTAKRARADGVIVAGKTGTAQTPHGRTHAWFCGFAPYDDPKICLVVLLEHGGRGGVEPAEIARGVVEEAKSKGYL